ncbi:MAG: DUF4145 domain-containing protein [Bryobacteraceae bacterium]
MTIEGFRDEANLDGLNEIGKVCHLAFYFLKKTKTEEFTAGDGARWLTELRYSKPNVSRLDDNLRSSRDTIRGSRDNTFRLQANFVTTLERRFPQLSEKSQDVVDAGAILPEVDYQKTRGYIETLAKQINASYENNLFDGCAVLMRRLVEVLLILSYRYLRIESAIQDGHGNYRMLDGVINDAKANASLALSRNSKACVDTFRLLGNFSAHKVEYTCRREYITPHIQEYRALITELLHKAGIRT